jgi:SAM-dependent methyltransferase
MPSDILTEPGAASRGQLTNTAAELYEAFFIPALFGQFATRMAEAAGAAPESAFLDVACGTGILAREAARRGARVAGVDCNPGMLAVARSKAADVDWREGLAEDLPFEEERFDAVGCQFGLMFFEDRAAALREMWRVLAPGGRLAVAVWDQARNSPGYAAMIALITRLFGAETAAALEAPFVLGEREKFAACFEAAGIGPARIETWPGTARFPSIEGWVRTDVKGWTLADLIDDAGYARLLAAARQELAGFAGPDGQVAFEAPAHVAIAVKESRAPRGGIRLSGVERV